MTDGTEDATLRTLTGTAPEKGSWTWTTSKASWSRRDLMRGRSQRDREILAMEPPLGTGTALPIGMKLLSDMLPVEHGAMIRTSWPQLANWPDRPTMCSFTPPLTA